jgi:hypothetical protein
MVIDENLEEEEEERRPSASPADLRGVSAVVPMLPVGLPR